MVLIPFSVLPPVLLGVLPRASSHAPPPSLAIVPARAWFVLNQKAVSFRPERLPLCVRMPLL